MMHDNIECQADVMLSVLAHCLLSAVGDRTAGLGANRSAAILPADWSEQVQKRSIVD